MPLPSITTQSLLQIELRTRNKKPIALLSWLGVSKGQSQLFSSTTLWANIMPVVSRQILWYSLPKGCDFCRQETHPMHVHLLNQIEMLSSKQTAHDG